MCAFASNSHWDTRCVNSGFPAAPRDGQGAVGQQGQAIVLSAV